MPAVTPPRLRGYRVEALLGAGAQATVWRGVRRRTGLGVALKHLPYRLPADLPEAEALAALDHPNLIRCHRVHRGRAASVLVLDLAAGGSLADLLARRGSLPPGEVIAAVTPVAAALAAVHGAGLVHADVSPANILFGADGLPVLSDLGSAYWIDDPRPTTVPAPGFADPLVEAGMLIGSPGDVYGLAAVAARALTGAPTRADLAEFGRLGEVVTAALVPSAAERPTMAEFACELRWSGPMSVVDLHAGRHSVLAPLPAITRGARLPGADRHGAQLSGMQRHGTRQSSSPGSGTARSGSATAGAGRSLSRPLHRWRRASRDTPLRRPSR